MEKKDLIGRKVKGFKFKDGEFGLGYNPVMDDYIGEIGVIDGLGIENEHFIVKFKSQSWIYPESLIVKNLVPLDEEQRKFDSGSVRDNDKNKPLVNHLHPYARIRFGYHMRKGANKYGKGNWQLGQPDETALESLNRHLALFENGDRSEDHLSAIIFNTQLIMMNEQKNGVETDLYFKK